MDKFLRLLGSKTVIGAAGGVLTWLTTLPVIDAKHAIGAASGLLAVAGIRDALHQITDALANKASGAAQ